jgi:hypothetical protein
VKTTKEHFEFYKSEVKKNLKLWGLVGWDAIIIHKKIDEYTITQMENHREARAVIFTFNTDIHKSYGDDYPTSVSALHEVLELFFDKIENMVCASLKEEAREEVHKLIQTIINVNKNGR